MLTKCLQIGNRCDLITILINETEKKMTNVTDTFYTENGSLWCVVKIDQIKTYFGTVRTEYLAEEVENGARMWFDEDTVIQGSK